MVVHRLTKDEARRIAAAYDPTDLTRAVEQDRKLVETVA
jgi:hypothetical protein